MDEIPQQTGIGDEADTKTPEIRHIDEIEAQTKRTFPFLTRTDRSEYDTYDPNKDENNRGRLLIFTGEQSDNSDGPKVMYIFKPSGFVINYYNSPEPEKPYTIRNVGNSLYGPKERRWREDEVDLALEKAKIHMDGIDHTSEEFLNQPVGWSDVEQRFLTMGEIMASWERYKNEPKSFKEKNRRMQTTLHKSVFQLLEEAPEKAKELAIARISKDPTYTDFDGQTSPTKAIVEHITQDDAAGKKAVLREMNRIEAQQTLLRDRGLFPRV